MRPIAYANATPEMKLMHLPSLYALWYRKRLGERGGGEGELSVPFERTQQSGGIPLALAAE